MTRTFRARASLWCFGLVLVAVLGGTLYIYVTHTQNRDMNDSADIASRVSRHMVLPTDEAPVLGTVTDVEELRRRQPFFAQAQNGDRVLIYAKNAKVIIYSEQLDRIVNVGPLYLSGTGSTTAQQNI